MKMFREENVCAESIQTTVSSTYHTIRGIFLCTTLTLSGGFDICNGDDILLLNLKGLVSVFDFSMRKNSYKVAKVNTIKDIASRCPNFCLYFII